MDIDTVNNERSVMLKYYLENLDTEFNQQIESMNLECMKTINLLKINLESELKSLPDSIRNMNMYEFLEKCIDYNNSNKIQIEQQQLSLSSTSILQNNTTISSPIQTEPHFFTTTLSDLLDSPMNDSTINIHQQRVSSILSNIKNK
ncbi:hypothetical protein DLAC_08122 [Tieghemostelium lacteum]|uniref:Borealin N-terminal domain-containing protein n=1 Tax=Tieghemostelium lacteum TaxID=361077 RepID=A0A151ZB77_TIELA|nr:hypothetical protein DLAC_08122 [Tieghemostelium lacteum]|eukprot:KYQ91200.1 hypothetical protein DLAC_08122 [Tieghemostelium lacteum]